MTTSRIHKNKTTYNKAEHNKDNPYVRVSSVIYQDVELNATETGILVYLLSNAESFTVNKNQVLSWSGLGRVTFNKSWKKLMSNGYINKELIQSGVLWTINEDPLNVTKSESSIGENLTKSGFSVTESCNLESRNSESRKVELEQLPSNNNLTSSNNKLLLSNSNIKNKLLPLHREEVSIPLNSKSKAPQESINTSFVVQKMTGHIGVALPGEIKPVGTTQKKDKGEQFEDWYTSYPDRGAGNVKGKKKTAKARFMKLSEAEREKLVKATKLLKTSNAQLDPKFYSYAEKFILNYNDTLDAYPVYENQNIDDGSGFFEH